MTESILVVNHVSHFFTKGNNLKHTVLEDFNLSLRSGEIIGMLGRSGSGKSTLLRIIAGLITPSTGEILYKNQPLIHPTPSLAMVFQNFALFPWMNVLQNVELGLLAKHLPRKEIKKRALSGIDLIGLDGYEQAYPRELSGGMRQRVGFARALVTHPDILLMDEPFSALDVLTAETLRNDFIELWLNRTLPIQSAILVTHNIEEAVLMCDRLLIFATNPGQIISEIPVQLPHPRDRNSHAFKVIVENVYLEMTEHLTSKRLRLPTPKEIALNVVLPSISSNIFSGFLETLAEPPYNGCADLSILSSSLHLEVDDIFPIAESLQSMDLALVTEGDVQLTTSGLLFVQSDTDQRKKIFADKLIKHVALARLIVDTLKKSNHAVSKRYFLDIIQKYMTEKAAMKTLQSIITWGRYAEIFAYHDSSETFSFENPD